MNKLYKLRHMIGPYFFKAYEGSGWCFKFGFYWFSIMFFKAWNPKIRYEWDTVTPWTGFMFNYNPTPNLKEGNLIWQKSKKWIIYER